MSKNGQDKLNDNKRKRDDKKYLIIMIISTLICGILGFFCGNFLDKIKKTGFSLKNIPDEVINMLACVMPILFLTINLILVIITVICVRKSRKEFRIWNGEDEDAAEKIENRVSIPLCISCIVNVINMFMFAVCVDLVINSTFSEKKEDILLSVNILIFVLAMAIVITVQKMVIDVTKDMNPEKTGSVFDTKFSEKWEKSCDEAQKLQIYKAGSAGYKAMCSVCLTLWVICFMADLFANVGLLPVTMVIIIWLTGIIGYLVGAAKADKEKN